MNNINDTVKILLNINNNDKDEIINYHSKSIKQSILNTCNLSVFPNELEYIVIEIVKEKLSSKNPKSTFEYLKEYKNELDNFNYVQII